MIMMSSMLIIFKLIVFLIAVIIIHTILTGLIGAVIGDIYTSKIFRGSPDRRILIAERYARPIGTNVLFQHILDKLVKIDFAPLGLCSN
jgi:hypothetical protein